MARSRGKPCPAPHHLVFALAAASSSALCRAQFHPSAFAAPEQQHRGGGTNFKPLTFVSCASESPGHHGSYVEPIEEGKHINKMKSQFAT